MHLAPGDPLSYAMENPNVTESVRARWRQAYGLDRSIPEQYGIYLVNVAKGDFGWSFSKQRPVLDVLEETLPNTLLLMTIALAASFALGILLAVVQATKPGSITDRGISAVSLLLFSMPEFWLAMMVILLLPHYFPRLPIGGMTDPVTYDSLSAGGRLLQVARYTILPAFTLTLLYSAVIARYQRAELLNTLPSDYIMTARAKGVPERTIIRRHALRNALLPVITLFGLAFPMLLTGAVFIEKVFSWPGMGLVIVESIDSRDYPLLMAGVIVGSVLVAVGSLIADLLYFAFDPRLRDER